MVVVVVLLVHMPTYHHTTAPPPPPQPHHHHHNTTTTPPQPVQTKPQSSFFTLQISLTSPTNHNPTRSKLALHWLPGLESHLPLANTSMTKANRGRRLDMMDGGRQVTLPPFPYPPSGVPKPPLSVVKRGASLSASHLGIIIYLASCRPLTVY